MSAMLLRVLIFAIIGALVFWGVRRIWREWRGEAKRVDEAVRQRDLRERARPDVITLKRDKDGTFRPGDGES
jgi:hypothetical protein